MSINSWESLPFEFPQELDINTCPRTIVYNTCGVINVSGDTLNADENFEDKYEYGFRGSFLNKSPYYHRWQYQNAFYEDSENTKIE